MATIGGSLYANAVYEFVDGLGTYNVERACAVLAADADLQSPWNEGVLTGRDAIQEVLAGLVSSPATRPSFTINNVRGDGNLVRLDVSMSQRFGRAPTPITISCLQLKGVIHHVMIAGRDGAVVPTAPVESMDLATPAEAPKAAEAAEPAEAAPAKPAPAETKKPAAPVATAAPADATYVDYLGDVDDVIDVEGIGPIYAKKLADMGVYTTARLRWESPDKVAAATGAKPGSVTAWRAMAELMKVNGIAGQYAEILYRGGCESIEALQNTPADEIVAGIESYLAGIKTTVTKNKITAKRVQGWQKAAKGMKPQEQPIPQE